MSTYVGKEIIFTNDENSITRNTLKIGLEETDETSQLAVYIYNGSVWLGTSTTLTEKIGTK